MNFLNNTFVTLESPVSSSDRVIFVKKFIGNLGENFPLSAVLQEADSTGTIIKREIIRITGKNDTMLNVERAVEPCPQSDTAERPSQNPLNFSENAVIFHTLTAGDLGKFAGKLGKSEMRNNLENDDFVVVEDGIEKIKSELPNSVNKDIDKLIINKLSEEKIIRTGIIREQISNSETAIVYLEGGEYIEEVPSYKNVNLSVQRDIPFQIVGISWFSQNYSSGKTFTITPFAVEDGRQLADTGPYSVGDIRNLNSKHKLVRVKQNGYMQSGDGFVLKIKYTLEAGFYKFRHNSVFGKICGFAKNKNIGEEYKVEDILHKITAEVSLSDGDYWINQDNLITTRVDEYSNRLRLGSVKDGILELNLRNYGTYHTKTYITFGVCEGKTKTTDVRGDHLSDWLYVTYNLTDIRSRELASGVFF